MERPVPQPDDKAFFEAVNMTAAALEKWLRTEESRSVGITHEGESQSVGHRSGERIVQILRKKKTEIDDDDRAHMAKVVGYVHRHMKQGPKRDIEHSRWRYSLMNWGHDPLKT